MTPAELRRTVLDAWAAAPARFREDANAEEELALGGYRDRLVVELAQNAADAAARAGTPGRLRLTLRDGVLAAANTGEPLSPAGVEALSTLRASAKRDDDPDAVGRFGVGFAAVLAVSDEPAVISRTTAVRWSLAEARLLAAEIPALAGELARREGAVPVLRLPLEAEGAPPEGYDTVVMLPLRDAAAGDLAARLLAEIDDALLLTLPHLAEVVVETPDGVRVMTRRQDEDGAVVVTDGDRVTRWRVTRAAGVPDAALLADRPVEERRRARWSVLWAVPVNAAGAPVRPATARVVHAPTPTDEPCGLPALLVASYPLDSTRRHVAPGALRDFVTARAAGAYAGLLATWPHGPSADLLALVPGPAAEGEIDAELRRAILARLAETAFLPADADPETALRPRDAVLVEGAGPALVEALSPVVPGLVPAGLDRSPAPRLLPVRRLPLAEVVDLLASLEREPRWWRGLYAALDPGDRDALGALPVPLADGRVVRGPRGLLLPGPDTPDLDLLDPLGLRVVDPEAAHPLLESLGAVPAIPRAILTDPAVRAAVAGSADDDDPDALADAVLALVKAAGTAPGDEPWLEALALPDQDGELVPAGELLLPGGPLASVVDPDALGEVDAQLVERWGAGVLEAVGVLRTFARVTDADVLADHDSCDHDLDAEDEWLDDVLDRLPEHEVPPVLAEFTAVRDLDLVAPGAWPAALELLAAPPLRAAVVEPVRVLLPDGGRAHVPSYTAWWLREHPVLDGRRPAGLLAAGADPLLSGLYEEVDAPLDPVFLAALGVRTTLGALLAEPGGPDELLDHLADPARPVGRDQLRAVLTALADVDPDRVGPPPDVLRAVVDGRVVVARADACAVGDAPDLAALVAHDESWALLPVHPGAAAALARVLDVPLLSEVVTGRVLSHGVTHPVPEAVTAALPGAPRTYTEHEELVVEGPGGAEVEADWRYTGGTVHATTFEGLARGLAWAAGEWHRRFEVAQLLADPSLAPVLDGERDFDTV